MSLALPLKWTHMHTLSSSSGQTDKMEGTVLKDVFVCFSTFPGRKSYPETCMNHPSPATVALRSSLLLPINYGVVRRGEASLFDARN